jgi:hypothetical protein
VDDPNIYIVKLVQKTLDTDVDLQYHHAIHEQEGPSVWPRGRQRKLWVVDS